MKLRKAWVQLHWLIGIVAGSVLMLVGLSGATLAFREEILDALNPGSRHVAAGATAPLSLPQLLAAVQRRDAGLAVATLTVYARPGAAPKVTLAAGTQAARGATLYLDPYTGAPLPELAGAAFFDGCERLHRFLLLPREPGRVAAGVLATCLLVLALSGLYLRWPRRPLAWRAWLTFDVSKKGRAFLWGLHSVAGTVALALYLVSASTGLYWSFDAVRNGVGALVGDASAMRAATPAPRTARARTPAAAASAGVDIAPAWSAFERRAGGWSEVIVRVPASAGAAAQFTWLDPAPPHERARNVMTVSLPAAQVTRDERYAAKSAGGRFLAAIHPLHMGSYFGLPGRIAMAAGALMLPVFGVTGWLMYLARRKALRGAARAHPRSRA
jgi:sulfite reductase (NADPH) flavoprotein alpha-component